MKQRLLLPLGLLVLASLAAPAHAQRWTGTLKVGGAVSNFSGDTVSGTVEFEPRLGMSGGIGFGYDFGNGLALGSELLYVVKGAYADVTIEDVPSRIRSDVTYIEVPLLAQYRFETNGRLHPKLFAGPMVAFKMNSQVQFRAKGSDLTQSEEDNSVESIDYGAVLGGGIEFDVSGQRLSLETRASLGIADTTKPTPDAQDPTLRNVGVVFLVGITF